MRLSSPSLDLISALADIHFHLPQPAQYIPPTAGPIIALPSRARIGTHTGLWNYTLGQKARIGGCAERMYVVGKDKDWEGGAGAVWVATG